MQFRKSLADNLLQIQKTRPEFEGDVTLVVFPLLRITKKNPEESGKMIGEFLTQEIDFVKGFNAIADEIPEKIAANAFFEMRYTNKGFEAGMRYELFMPPIQGYDSRWEGNGFGYKYLRYKNDRVDVTAGNFYEQFGVTLIIAILISAVNALTLSPALCALLLKEHKEDEELKGKGPLKRFYR